MSTINGGWRGANIVRDGLVLYLDASSGTSYTTYINSSIWKDISTNNYTGSLVNTTFESNSGGGIIFNGSTSTLTTNLSNTPNNSTQAVWFKWNGVNQSRVLTYLGTQPVTNGLMTDGMGLFISNTFGGNGNKITIQYGGFNFNATSTSGDLTSNVYTNLAITRDGTTTTLYKDGVSIGSTASTPSGSTVSFTFKANDLFGGTLANVLFYNRGLSAIEILQNYNATRARFGL